VGPVAEWRSLRNELGLPDERGHAEAGLKAGRMQNALTRVELCGRPSPMQTPAGVLSVAVEMNDVTAPPEWLDAPRLAGESRRRPRTREAGPRPFRARVGAG